EEALHDGGNRTVVAGDEPPDGARRDSAHEMERFLHDGSYPVRKSDLLREAAARRLGFEARRVLQRLAAGESSGPAEVSEATLSARTRPAEPLASRRQTARDVRRQVRERSSRQLGP